MCLDHLYKRINGFQKKKINYGGFRELQGRFLTKNKLCIYIYIYTHYIFVVGTRAHVAKLQVPTCSTGYSNPPRNTWRNCKRQLVALVTPAFPGTGGETASANLRRWLLPPSQESRGETASANLRRWLLPPFQESIRHHSKDWYFRQRSDGS